jgi:hypothetical protein
MGASVLATEAPHSIHLEYPSHSQLISALTANIGPTVTQQSFYGDGKGGDATYAWSAGSYCPGGTSGSPATADGIVCILPSTQSASTAGRYLLQPSSGGIDVRTLGFQADGPDNSALVPTLMSVLANGGYEGGQSVIFPATPGQGFTAYYFSKPFVIDAGGEYKCSGTRGASGIELVFAAGQDGMIQEGGSVSPTGGYGEGTIDSCTIISLGEGYAYAAQNSSTLSSVGMNADLDGLIPATTWHVGDGIIATPGGGGYYAPLTIAAGVQPGAYISGVSGSTLTLAAGYTTNPLLYGYATAPFTENGPWNFTAGDTIQVGNITETAVTSGTAAGTFQIGANWAAAVANLASAINTNAAGAAWGAPLTTPNVSALQYNTVTANTIVFTDLTLGTAGNSFASVYTPAFGPGIENPAGSFPSATFQYGYATANASGLVINQLPVALKYTVQTTIGSDSVLVTAGPRLLVPGDLVWSDAFPFGTMVLTASGTLGNQTVTMDSAFLTAGGQNALATHTSGSPGQLWVIPAGIKRDAAANASNNYITYWPVGLEMACTSASPFNCTTSHDLYNTYLEDWVGRWTAGDNTGASDSIGEEWADNYVTDFMEGGTVGSAYFNPNSNSVESGTALYGPMGNCYNDNFSAMFGGYVVPSAGSCAASVGLVPSTSGSPWIEFTNQAYLANGGGPYISNSPAYAELNGEWHASGSGLAQYCAMLSGSGTASAMFGVSTSCSLTNALVFGWDGSAYTMDYWVYGTYIQFPTTPDSANYYPPIFPGGLQIRVTTIGGLPTCNSTEQGLELVVNNGVASPTYASTVSTTGSTAQKVFCNGTNWTYQ